MRIGRHDIGSSADLLKSKASVHKATCSFYCFPLGPILIFIALSIFKSNAIASNFKAFLWLSKVDMIFFGALLLLVLALLKTSKPALRIFFHILIISGLFAFQLQVISLTLFDMNLTLSNVVDFAPEWRWNMTFVKWHHLVLLAFAIAAYIFLWVPLSGKQALWLSGIAVCCLSLGLAPIKTVPDYAKKYVFDIRTLITSENSKAANCLDSYQARETQIANRRKSQAELLNLGSFEGRNMILAVIESMSTVDSFRSSGLNNIFPRFDRISQNGILFRNAFANYYQTSGGLVALFNGVAPLSYPLAKVPLLNAFDSQAAVPSAFKDLGYKTIFLKNAPLAFENTRSYSRRIGFDFTAGYDEIERYRGKPTFTCGVVADEYLMEETVDQVSKLLKEPQPFFLALLTTSSHVPWVDPLGRGNTPENVFDYVDQQIEALYLGLEKIGFFKENGILVLTSDHRKPQPISEEERQKYGDGARSRIPVFIMGNGISRGVLDDRFLSQADLFKKFENLVEASTALSPYAIYVDHYSRLVWQDQPKSNFAVFLSEDQGRTELSGTVSGACLRWNGTTKAIHSKIERDIHVQRASHQENFLKKATKCNLIYSDKVKWVEDKKGVLMRIYTGTDLSGELGEKSPRLIKSIILPNFASISPSEHGAPSEMSVFEFEAGVYVPENGIYWFSVQSDRGACLNINERIIIDANEDTQGGDVWGHALLKRGPHRILIRTLSAGKTPIKITWAKKPDRAYWTRSKEKQWVPVPDDYLFQPIPE